MPFTLVLRSCFPLAAERHGLQFSPLASPHSQRNHQSGRSGLHEPPVERVRDAMRVERGDDQVDEVDRQSEIGDEFGAGD